MTIAMAETLAAHTSLIDSLGSLKKVDMARVWQANDAFLDLITVLPRQVFEGNGLGHWIERDIIFSHSSTHHSDLRGH